MPQAELHAVTDLETRALTLPEQAKAIVIVTPADYTAAGEFVKQMDALIAEIRVAYDDNIAAAHKLHRDLIAKRDKYAAPPTVARLKVRDLMAKWTYLQEIERQAEEARLQARARKAEEEAKLAAALEAEANGQKEEAQAILEEEVYVPPVIVKKDVPKVQGVQFRTVWKWRLKDIRKVPSEYLMLDEVKIGAVIRARKQAGEVIPGIEAYSEKQ
jgi:hypothetical protein